MDINTIAQNVKKMLEYRLNSNHFNFDVVFKNYTPRPKKARLTYEIKTEKNNVYTIFYSEESNDEQVKRREEKGDEQVKRREEKGDEQVKRREIDDGEKKGKKNTKVQETTVQETNKTEYKKVVFVNIELNDIRKLLAKDVIIIYNKVALNRKINQLLASSNEIVCELLPDEMFEVDYTNNVYFSQCSKSKDETNDKIQFISYREFYPLFLGLKPNEKIFTVTTSDSTLFLPQIRVVKK